MLALLLAAAAHAAPYDPNAFALVSSGQSDIPVDFDTAASVSIDTGATPPTFTTDGTTWEGVVDNGIAVFTFDGLTIDESVSISGNRPLAILSRGDLTVSSQLDVDANNRFGGPGGANAPNSGGNGNGPGGGDRTYNGSESAWRAAGGGFGGAGGDNGNADGGASYGDLLVLLEGGSSGATADGAHDGGGGGGAVELGALGRLLVTAHIRARGATGAGGGNPSGGGGGSGGGILLHGGPGSACDGNVDLDVRGGNGGQSHDDFGGAGGGGGRIALLNVDLLNNCDPRVSGGSSGAGDEGSGAGGDGDFTSSLVDIADPDVDGDGVTTDAGDCNDNDPDTYPGAPEICDDFDQDCDGQTTDGCDADGDGYDEEEDCDDGDASINPGATPVVGDNVDNDCSNDGVGDECYADVDEDGYGSDVIIDSDDLLCDAAGESDTDDGDCDDLEPTVNPDGVEQTCTALDEDCDPMTPDEPDGDGDGESVCVDCDDTDSSNYFGNTEVCDGADNDCDGVADNDLTFELWFPDMDGDGFGDDALGTSLCADPMDGSVTQDGDCDDLVDTTYTGAPELCDGVDNDCNSLNDFGGTPGSEVDGDGDGDRVCDGDCDDADITVGPGAPELCDGKDNDCDGEADFDGPDSELDADGDGARVCDGDCNDAEPLEVPGGTEVCDGLDNDCDTDVDEGFATQDWYADGDGDGFGAGTATVTCEVVPDAVTVDGDCNDADPTIRPGVSDGCDGVDNDCDGAIDEDSADVEWFEDQDGDGFGDPLASAGLDCQPPIPGAVSNDEDCDDSSAAIRPSAAETCDGVDNNCDGNADEGLPTQPYYTDADGDGYGDENATPVDACGPPPNTSAANTDCDDSAASISPVAPELCDFLDNDCDGVPDDGLPVVPYYDDPDDDGYGDAATEQFACTVPLGAATQDGDCAPNNGFINPDADEICDDIDNDCDEEIDEGLTLITLYDDLDGDGFGDQNTPSFEDCAVLPDTTTFDGDCDDDDSSVFPGANEQCDTIDNDCDGEIDEESVPFDWYTDLDGDGFGDPGSITTDCAQPPGTVQSAGDCDDAEALVNPSADEICDGIDNDCDGDVDDDDGDLVATLYYPDNDLDGFGAEGSAGVAACDQPLGFAEDDRDCEDGSPAINPNAVEACPDGIDNDCDGLIDDEDPSYSENPVTLWFDNDGDGFGTPTAVFEGCPSEAPLGYVSPAAGVDCDDQNSANFPGNDETCDAFDNDCDGDIDEGYTPASFFSDEDGDLFGDPATAVELPEECPEFYETDLVPDGGDCDDANAAIHPDAVEICDGIDNNCDGDPDEGVTTTYYVDADLDGYGDSSQPVEACDPPADAVLIDGDCDDQDDTIAPNASEVCDGADNDCNDEVDDGLPSESYWPDQDEDGLGDSTATGEEACEAPEGFVDNMDDCDDTVAGDQCSGRAERRSTGCGCDSRAAGSGPLAGLAVLLLLAARRRRSAA